MQSSLLKKLRREVRQYQSKDFLKATMAVCTLSAAADHEVTPDEILRIDHLILDEPALRHLDAKKARQKLKEYLSALKNNRAKAERVLSKKTCPRRSAGSPATPRSPARSCARPTW
jgi:tellurite resistance protein